MASAKATPAQRALMERIRVNWIRMYDALMAEGLSREEVAYRAGVDRLRYYHHKTKHAHPGIQVCLGLVIASDGRFTFQTLLDPEDTPLPDRVALADVATTAAQETAHATAD